MATRSSTSTKALCGCTYEQLIKRERQLYCLHEPWLISVNGLSFVEATDKLQTQIERILDDIDDQMRPNFRVKDFTIGKSFVTRRSKSSGFVDFKELKPNTWTVLGGVNKRWENFYKGEKYDGLIVLCVTPRNSIPDHTKRMTIGPQEYAIALEQRLIQNFYFIKKDVRLNNKSLESGSKAKDPYAGLVYIAFKLQDLKGVKQKGETRRDEGADEDEQTNNEQRHETQEEEKPKGDKPKDKEPMEEKHRTKDLKDEENDKQTSKDVVQTDRESTTNNAGRANEENAELPNEEYTHDEDN